MPRNIQQLGVGYLPKKMVEPAAERGELIIKSTENSGSKPAALIAWRNDHQGKALKWFVEKLKTTEMKNQLLTGTSS